MQMLIDKSSKLSSEKLVCHSHDKMSSSSSAFPSRLENPMFCECGSYVKLYQSWTDKNPGRKFYCCPNVDPTTNKRSCKFWKWHDDIMTNWQREIILRLKSENLRMHQDMEILRKDLVSTENEAKKLQTEVIMLKCKRPETEVHQANNKLCIFTVVVVVVGVWIATVLGNQI